ncbi:conserved hypothetical protein [gamma proteobacterium HTCC5015]|nr:conserved hypothetical protein [gamma proteobacterium HTCC5015]
MKKQQGMTMWSLLILASIVGTLFYQGLVLFTPMSNYFTIEKIVTDITSDPEAKNMSSREIREKFEKFLNLNNIRNFDQNSREFLDFKDTRDGRKMVIHYSQTVEFIEPVNFEVLMDKEILLGGQ